MLLFALKQGYQSLRVLNLHTVTSLTDHSAPISNRALTCVFFNKQENNGTRVSNKATQIKKKNPLIKHETIILRCTKYSLSLNGKKNQQEHVNITSRFLLAQIYVTNENTDWWVSSCQVSNGCSPHSHNVNDSIIRDDLFN